MRHLLGPLWVALLAGYGSLRRRDCRLGVWGFRIPDSRTHRIPEATIESAMMIASGSP